MEAKHVYLWDETCSVRLFDETGIGNVRVRTLAGGGSRPRPPGLASLKVVRLKIIEASDICTESSRAHYFLKP